MNPDVQYECIPHKEINKDIRRNIYIYINTFSKMNILLMLKGYSTVFVFLY